MKGLTFWFLAMAGIVAGIYFVPQLLTSTLNSETPAAVVISRSMWPVLNRGDIVIIKGTSREEIQEGTILIFRHGGGIAIHRVVRLTGETIFTKGDANPEEDEPITFEDVVGRLPTLWGHNAKIPWLGHIALLAGSRLSAPLEEEPAAKPTGVFGPFAGVINSPVALALLVVFPAGLFLMVVAMEIIPRVGPGRRKRRWRQRRMEWLAKRRPRAKLAYR